MTAHLNARRVRGALALGVALACAAVASPAAASPLGDAIVNFARARMGHCVEGNGLTHPGACPALAPGQVGPGECTQLAQAALAAEGAAPPMFHGAMPPSMLWYEYMWGKLVGPPYQPGDIIQFWFFSAKAPNGATWSTSRGHTAIITQAHPGGMISLLEQNAPVRAVSARWLDLHWEHTGWYFVYRPQARSAFVTPPDAPVTPSSSAKTSVFR